MNRPSAHRSARRLVGLAAMFMAGAAAAVEAPRVHVRQSPRDTPGDVAAAGDRRDPHWAAAAKSCRDQTLPVLVQWLGDERFHIRQSAHEELLRRLRQPVKGLANPVEAACFDAYHNASDPEVSMRAREVLAVYATELWSPLASIGMTVEPDPSTDDAGNRATFIKARQLIPNGPALRAGIRKGDRIRGLDDSRFQGPNAVRQFEFFLSRKKPGDQVVVHTSRDHKSRNATLTLVYQPRPKKRRNPDGSESTYNPEDCLQEYLKFKRGR